MVHKADFNTALHVCIAETFEGTVRRDFPTDYLLSSLAFKFVAFLRKYDKITISSPTQWKEIQLIGTGTEQ